MSVEEELRAVLRRNGTTLRPGQLVSDEQAAAIKRLSDRGVSRIRLARRYGVSVSTVDSAKQRMQEDAA